MKKRKYKQLLASVIACSMVLSGMPATAYAAGQKTRLQELPDQKIQAVPDSRKILETRRLPERMKAHRLNQTAIVRQTVHRITHPRTTQHSQAQYRTTQHSQAQHRTTQLPSRQQLMRRVRRMRKRLRQEMYWRFTKVRQSKVLRC